MEQCCKYTQDRTAVYQDFTERSTEEFSSAGVE